MFARNWRRLRRLEGWRPYGLLAVILLAGAILTDDLYVEYDQTASRLQEVKASLLLAKEKAARLPELAKQRLEVDAAYGGVSGRLVAVTEGEQEAGSAKFSQMLRSWYESKGITQLVVRNVERREEGDIVFYRAEVEAAMWVDKFVGLLQGRPFAPLALRLEHATVDANDAVAPTGLRTVMTWEGVQAPPQPPEEEAVKPEKKSEKSSPKPSASASVKKREVKSGAPAVKILEEKRK